jgi:hypothetical protein
MGEKKDNRHWQPESMPMKGQILYPAWTWEEDGIRE